MNQGKSIAGASIHRSNRVPTRTRTRETSLVAESVGMIAQHPCHLCAGGLDDETRERFLEGDARRIFGLDRDRSAAE